MKKSRIISVFLAGTLAFGSLGVTAFAKDINGDGKTNISDVTALLKKITSKTTTLDDDVNGDGKVNIADATALLKSIVGGSGSSSGAAADEYVFKFRSYGYGYEPNSGRWVILDDLGYGYLRNVEVHCKVSETKSLNISKQTPSGGLFYTNEKVTITKKDIENIGKLTNLESLVICSDQLDDLTPLTGLTKLKRLVICSKNLTDLSPLSKLTSLENVTVCSTSAPLYPLISLPNLDSVMVMDYKITEDEADSLSKCKRMTSLDLSYCVVEKLAPLARTPKLGKLWLYCCDIRGEDITPLTTMDNLGELCLAYSGVSASDMETLKKKLKYCRVLGDEDIDYG